ncbi:hypothetical protein DMENIID0001_001070 [Sergentomyia squamirostris]
MLTHGFEQMLSEPTRSCSGTCIDHVFLRSFTDKYTCSCGTIDLNVSDHKLVTILLSGPSDLTPKPREDAQDTIRKINFDNLRRNLLEEGWVGVYTATNSSVMFQSFIDRLRTLVDKNTRVVSFSREYIPRNPWVSYDLCRELRIKNNIIALSRRRPGDLCLKRRAGRVARSVRHKITLAREEYFVQKFRESVGNPKKQWGTVNRILGKRRKDRQITELMIDDVIINDVGEIAESLNNFFVNVPVALSNQITRCVNPGAHLAENAVGSIFLSPVSGSEAVESYKYLGVTFDDKLAWREHVRDLSCRLMPIAQNSKRLRKSCPTSVLKAYYSACAESLLNYGISLWGGTCKATLDPIYRAQRYVIRSLTGKRRSDSLKVVWGEWKVLPVRYKFRIPEEYEAGERGESLLCALEGEG